MLYITERIKMVSSLNLQKALALVVARHKNMVLRFSESTRESKAVPLVTALL